MTGPIGGDKHGGGFFVSALTERPAESNWLTDTVLVVVVLHKEQYSMS